MSINEDFQSFYEKYYSEVYYVTYKLTRDEETAKDLTQDVFVKAYENYERLEENSNLRNWVLTIANNTTCNYLKRKKLIKFVSIEEDSTLVEKFGDVENRELEQKEIDTETKKILLHLIDELPREQRLCVFLYYYENMSVKDIAKLFECPEKTIYSRLSYSRKRLKEEIDKLENSGIKLRCTAALPFIFAVFTLEKSGMNISAEQFDISKAVSSRKAVESFDIKNKTMKGGITMAKGKIFAIAAAVVVLAGVGIGVAVNSGKSDDDTVLDTEMIDSTEYTGDESISDESISDENVDYDEEDSEEIKDGPALDADELSHEVGYFNKGKTDADGISFVMHQSMKDYAVVTYKSEYVAAEDFFVVEDYGDDGGSFYETVTSDGTEKYGGQPYISREGLYVDVVPQMVIQLVDRSISNAAGSDQIYTIEIEEIDRPGFSQKSLLDGVTDYCTNKNTVEVYEDNGFCIEIGKGTERTYYNAYYELSNSFVLHFSFINDDCTDKIDKDFVSKLLGSFTIDYYATSEEFESADLSDKMFYEDKLAEVLENNYSIYVRDLRYVASYDWDEVLYIKDDNKYTITDMVACRSVSDEDGEFIGTYDGKYEVYFQTDGTYTSEYLFWNRSDKTAFEIQVQASIDADNTFELHQMLREELLK